jgi:DNA replication licensing factor MCM7
MNLVDSIETNAKHYLDIMSKAVDKVMPDPTREIK